MSLKVHMRSACTAMTLKFMGYCTLHGDQANESGCRIFTNYSANIFVLTGVHLDKKQYSGKTI